MTDERFQEQAINVDIPKLVDIIHEMSFARRIFPEIPVGVSDRTGTYHRVKENSNVQLNLDLVAPKYSDFATQKMIDKLPVHQADLAYDRHERMRMAKDILKLDQRQRLAVEQIVDSEEKLVFAGNDKNGITSFNDTGTNSTAAADELDLGTFVEGVQHYHTSLSQLRNLLKNKFQGSKLYVAWTTDVDDRARAINSTTSEHITFYDYLVGQLAGINGGNGAEYIVPTNYLGSEAGTGTVSMAMIASDPRNLGLFSSPLEVFSGPAALGGIEIQLALRSAPAFLRGVSAVIYHGTCVLTA